MGTKKAYQIRYASMFFCKFTMTVYTLNNLAYCL